MVQVRSLVGYLLTLAPNVVNRLTTLTNYAPDPFHDLMHMTDQVPPIERLVMG